MRGTFAPKSFFVRHWGALANNYYWFKSTWALGLRPDDMTKYSLANKIRMISEQLIFWAFFDRHTGAWATILRMESETYPPSAHLRFFVRFLERHGDWMANEIRTTFYIFVILLYFVRQGDPFGEQYTNVGHFRTEVVFCSPLRRPGEQITNDFRTILFLSFFGSPNKCLGDHFTNGIRNISTFGFLFVFCAH